MVTFFESSGRMVLFHRRILIAICCGTGLSDISLSAAVWRLYIHIRLARSVVISEVVIQSRSSSAVGLRRISVQCLPVNSSNVISAEIWSSGVRTGRQNKTDGASRLQWLKIITNYRHRRTSDIQDKDSLCEVFVFRPFNARHRRKV